MEVRRLRELLEYDPSTGQITWKVSRPGLRAGRLAGGVHGTGYRFVRVDGKQFAAHRIAWAMQTGAWPRDQIDHLNGVRDDNRFCNLRAADAVLNQQNRRVSSNSTSGLIGAQRNGNRWRALIRSDGRRISLGSFASPAEAHAAYLRAKEQLHAKSRWSLPSNGKD